MCTLKKSDEELAVFEDELAVNIDLTELAGILDTIPYEILTSVPRRIERVVIR